MPPWSTSICLHLHLSDQCGLASVAGEDLREMILALLELRYDGTDLLVAWRGPRPAR